MVSAYHKLYCHITWGTYRRLDLIDNTVERNLYQLIRAKIQEHNSELVCFGCTTDHVHLLIRLHPSVSVSGLVGSVKGYSSYMVANLLCPESGFRWQRGYGVLSLSEKELPRIKRYIENQKDHHSSQGSYENSQ